jgi:S-disulfanyl-L-cysteine oxidoreductase SoxD
MTPDRCAPTVVCLILLGASGAACSRDWRTDMWYQPSVRPEDAPRPEPEGSVALGAALLPGSRDEAEDLADPVPRSAASLAHGTVLFASRCAPCHGAEGKGGGPVSKYFPPAPDLTAPITRARSDGFLWGTITYGGRAMPPQREGLTPEDRWDLVHRVRAIQGVTQ